MTRTVKPSLLLIVFVLFTLPIFADNLLLDGSFESPGVPSGSTCGGYGPAECFYVNDNIGNWTVVGKSDNTAAAIMLMTNGYTEPVGGVSGNPTLNFNVENGLQAIDLTGEGNQIAGVDGVKQSVSLNPGTYDLSFWLGHQDSSAPGYTNGPSMLSLYVDGSPVNVYSNNLNTTDDVTWEQFTYDFTASGYTTIAFLNDTPTGNNYAGLDNVVLTQTPEPASLVLLASGLLGLGILRRK